MVFDADEEWDGRDEPYTQLAYWHDFGTAQLFFFAQLLFTPDDVLQSIAAMPLDLAIDPAPLIAEKPELGPLPEMSSPGQWRPAIEADVLAVMSGGQAAGAEGPGSDAEGTVSGLISPCAPNPNCDPAAAAASSSIPAPVRGTSRSDLFAIAQGASYCNCNGGSPPPPPPPDPFRNLHALANSLNGMSDDLLFNHFDPVIVPFAEASEQVVTTQDGVNYSAHAPIMLHKNAQEVRTGSTSVNTSDGSNAVSLRVVVTYDDGLEGPDPEWTLDQTMTLDGDIISSYGSIAVVESSGASYSLPGGWTYSETSGPLIHPSSSPEFQPALESMLAIDAPAVAGAGGTSIGSLLSTPANLVSLWLNYLRDRWRAYSPPSQCGGPIYEDGTSQSCTAEQVPCDASITSIALFIDDLPEVGVPFKKCMKGRFGCGGSYHPVLRLKCNYVSFCGPCGFFGPAGGCNLMGRDVWYCSNTPDECDCAMIIFHEAAHACGIGHTLQYLLGGGCAADPDDRACVIGFWFQDECNAMP